MTYGGIVVMTLGVIRKNDGTGHCSDRCGAEVSRSVPSWVSASVSNGPMPTPAFETPVSKPVVRPEPHHGTRADCESNQTTKVSMRNRCSPKAWLFSTPAVSAGTSDMSGAARPLFALGHRLHICARGAHAIADHRAVRPPSVPSAARTFDELAGRTASFPTESGRFARTRGRRAEPQARNVRECLSKSLVDRKMVRRLL